MARSRTGALALLGWTVLSVGCGRNTPPPAPAPAQEPPRAQPAQAQTSGQGGTDEAAEVRRRNMAILEEMVFFDYDQAQLTSPARQTLDQKVGVLRQNAGYRLVIEGHADERGSTEYNLALGTRRAVSIRDYLVGFGLEAQRFQTTSYGEERPLAQGQSEAAWSRNRRWEFRVSGGPSGENGRDR